MDKIIESIKVGFGVAVGFEMGKKAIKKAEDLYLNIKNSQENVKNN